MNDKEKYTKLAELYAALAEGKALQIRHNTLVWRDTCHEPSLLSDLIHWRVKPEPRVAA
jgi:hypothetical protein